MNRARRRARDRLLRRARRKSRGIVALLVHLRWATENDSPLCANRCRCVEVLFWVRCLRRCVGCAVPRDDPQTYRDIYRRPHWASLFGVKTVDAVSRSLQRRRRCCRKGEWEWDKHCISAHYRQWHQQVEELWLFLQHSFVETDCAWAHCCPILFQDCLALREVPNCGQLDRAHVSRFRQTACGEFPRPRWDSRTACRWVLQVRCPSRWQCPKLFSSSYLQK